jgi:hypothetical protein
LIAIAVLPVLAGIMNSDFDSAIRFSDGFHAAILIAAASLVAGGLLAYATIRRPLAAPPTIEPEEAPAFHCALDAPPSLVEIPAES